MAISPVQAQHSSPTNTVTVLASYTEIDRKVCRALAAPLVVITQAPTLGRASIQQSQRPMVVRGCGTLSVPYTEVVYQALSRPGSDALGWRVVYQALDRNRPTRATVQISDGKRQP